MGYFNNLQFHFTPNHIIEVLIDYVYFIIFRNNIKTTLIYLNSTISKLLYSQMSKELILTTFQLFLKKSVIFTELLYLNIKVVTLRINHGRVT